MRKNYLVCYDICDVKRSQKVRKYLYSLALGGQKSALFIPLNKSELSSIVEILLELTSNEDSINIIPIKKQLKHFGTKEDIFFERGVLVL